ncbi:MAG TPA: anti-sigma factor [Xanthobacteraceae bacterium]|jgi:anti-sigma factor RsiW|nr:anti-sigma factor [Xanthobacteraceae bacterium]HZO46853.1 anti-sigma factor [Xanthobacteraceae bacterium]
MTTNTPPEEPVLLVHAYLDGELDPANALAIERRIAADPALAAELARAGALRGVLRKRLPVQAPPPHLRARIDAALGLTRTDTAPSWRALAASVALAAVLASGSTFLALRPTPDDRAAAAIVAGHMRALMASQPTDVVSSDRHAVKPWFNGRIPQAPRIIDLAQDGFVLVGGRIDMIGSTPVPTLVYRIRQHLISLVAVPAANRADAAIARGSLNGYNLIDWSENGVTYWAVSDLGASELEKFATLFRTARPDG